MKESFISLITKFCALISSIYNCDERSTKKGFVQYLKSNINQADQPFIENIFTNTFKSNTQEHKLFEDSDPLVSFSSPLLDELIQTTIQTLFLKDRIILLMMVIDYFNSFHPELIESFRLIESIGCRVGLSHDEVDDLWNMVVNPDDLKENENVLVCRIKTEEEIEKLEGSWIESNLPDTYRLSNEIEIEYLKENMTILFLERNKLFVINCLGNNDLVIEGNTNPVCRFKILEPGTAIKIKKQTEIQYAELKKRFLEYRSASAITLSLEKVSHNNCQRKKGLKEINLQESSGQLIGILGKEGSGKTTLLELLAGRINADTGKIEINNYNLKTNKYFLKSIIGYVPEDDLLFDELTVFDNLLLVARMFFDNLPYKEQVKKVTRLLEKTDLYEYRNTIVGSVQEKNLQPGQRRILNIALELLRKPRILLVDNPVYGLNISESSKIIKLLHDYTFEGNLVITAIRQTNHFSFSMFDKLWVFDEGGYMIYGDACYKASEYFVSHLKNEGHDIIPDQNTPENILQFIELRISDTSGRKGERRITPEGWYRRWKKYQDNIWKQKSQKSLPLPAGSVKIPNLETQFRIFSIRNFKIKFSDKWKNMYLLAAGPVLALLLAFFLKNSAGQEYIFAENPNIPLYFFASSIICLYLGLMISSNEILKEKKILEKEEYLEFSRFSYINSKIAYLFVIAIFQTLLFAITGNAILEIKDMFFQTWMVLFSICCSGIVAGLIFSANLPDIKSIYEKAIVLLIGLQLLFGSGIFSYKNLNLSKSPFTPLIGDLMVTKWAYEALMVEQFTGNRYEKNIYSLERDAVNNLYLSNTLLPLLESYHAGCKPNFTDKDTLKIYLTLIKNTLSKLDDEQGVFPFEYLNKLNEEDYNHLIASETKDYLTYLKLRFNDSYFSSLLQKNNFLAYLKDSLGTDGFTQLRNSYFSNAVASVVQSTELKSHYKVYKNKIFQMTNPIYQKPVSDWGRSLLFVPEKELRGEVMNTLWFNITIIWLFTFIMYNILLIYQPLHIQNPHLTRIIHK